MSLWIVPWLYSLFKTSDSSLPLPLLAISEQPLNLVSSNSKIFLAYLPPSYLLATTLVKVSSLHFSLVIQTAYTYIWSPHSTLQSSSECSDISELRSWSPSTGHMVDVSLLNVTYRWLYILSFAHIFSCSLHSHILYTRFPGYLWLLLALSLRPATWVSKCRVWRALWGNQYALWDFQEVK